METQLLKHCGEQYYCVHTEREFFLTSSYFGEMFSGRSGEKVTLSDGKPLTHVWAEV